MSRPKFSEVLRVARSQLGYREGPNNDTKFGRWYGLNHNPWCAMFVSWVADESGATEIIPRFCYTPAGAAWFKKRGRYGTRPRKGAIGFVYSASAGRIYHTFFVEAVHPDGTFTTIEGNTNLDGSATGNGVYRLRRNTAIKGKYTFGYPRYAPERPTVFLKEVHRAAHLDRRRATGSHPASTRIVQRALRDQGVYHGRINGRFGKGTRKAYARWQRHLGYSGHAANGVPGRLSLGHLGSRYGFRVAD